MNRTREKTLAWHLAPPCLPDGWVPVGADSQGAKFLNATIDGGRTYLATNTTPCDPAPPSLQARLKTATVMRFDDGSALIPAQWQDKRFLLPWPVRENGGEAQAVHIQAGWDAYNKMSAFCWRGIWMDLSRDQVRSVSSLVGAALDYLLVFAMNIGVLPRTFGWELNAAHIQPDGLPSMPTPSLWLEWSGQESHRPVIEATRMRIEALLTEPISALFASPQDRLSAVVQKRSFTQTTRLWAPAEHSPVLDIAGSDPTISAHRRLSAISRMTQLGAPPLPLRPE